MAKKILLKNGQIVSSAEVFSGDVFVEGGKIKKVFRGGVRGGVRGDVRGGVAGAEGAVEIDCTGKLILPGLIDVHVHFREPGQTYKEDFYTGSMAAVCGGVTTVFDMPNNQPPIFTAKDLDAKRKLIVGKSYVNYGLYIGYNGRNIDEINAADGVCGVKIYSANSTGNMGVQDLETAFRQIKRDKLLAFHAEDEECIGEHYKKVLGSVALEKNFNGEIPAFVHSKIRAEECAVKMVSKICELARSWKL
ncbi:amidohydrolase family protein [Candidatus Peregrinibacteria bacterium]|nr:amidohydrolase family protein [Candidatus Peregrinibacteria bacterium]